MRFIDLFAGIGGFRLALEKKGLKCVFSSEIDKKCREIYKENFGEEPVGDIKEIDAREIPEHDVLCAGFPCQDFSISGKRKGLGGSRGALFLEIIRILQHHRPSVLLLENVPHILKMKGILETIYSYLRKLDYEVYVQVLNSSHYGIPQSRKRAYFVCLKSVDNKKPYVFPEPTLKECNLKQIIDEDVSENHYINKLPLNLLNIKHGIYFKPVQIGQYGKGHQGQRVYSLSGHSVTLKALGGGWGAKTGLYSVGGRIRRLSVNECRELMGFPKNFKGNYGYRELGNAVIPSMIERIWDKIVR